MRYTRRRGFGAGHVCAAVNVVLRFDPARAEDLRAFLRKGGFAFESRPHALFLATRPGVSLTAYGSGKILVTGAQAEEYAGVLVAAGHGVGEARPSAAPPRAAGFAPHVGGDESGKGDYFGPLCVAAVFVPDEATARLLAQKGVRDSKEVPEGHVGPLASLVRSRCPHAVQVLAPPRYNEVYEAFGNLNHLLASCHARVLEELLAQTGSVPVLVDQFARPDVLEGHLGPLARAAPVSQATGAEADVAVAAASLVARAEFLAGLAALEARHGLRLPRGAGPPVMRAAREAAARGGRGLLRDVAKLHFALTRAALRA